MVRNMGTADRWIRTIIAIVLVTLITSGQISGTWAIVAGVVAVVFVLTSLVSFCPLYRVLGRSSCRS
jgi:uncharacterized membrane protein YgaE (UPF0421/DUF939 family)